MAQAIRRPQQAMAEVSAEDRQGHPGSKSTIAVMTRDGRGCLGQTVLCAVYSQGNRA
jgi:hypothetical protein